MRRLAVISILLILAGLALLLPSSALYSLLTSGSTSSLSFELSRESSVTSNTTTVESLLGFGLVGVGLILEILSLFTDVGASGPGGFPASPPSKTAAPPAEMTPREEKKIFGRQYGFAVPPPPKTDTAPVTHEKGSLQESTKDMKESYMAMKEALSGPPEPRTKPASEKEKPQ